MTNSPRPTANTHQGVPERALITLLAALFNVDEFRQFVHQFGVSADLVATTSSYKTLLHEAVRALNRRGELDQTFFRALLDERPKRATRIHEVAAAFGVPVSGTEYPSGAAHGDERVQAVPEGQDRQAPHPAPSAEPEVLRMLTSLAEGDSLVKHRETTSLHLLHALLTGPVEFATRATVHALVDLGALEQLLKLAAEQERLKAPEKLHPTTSGGYERLLAHAREQASHRDDAAGVTPQDVLTAFCDLRPESVTPYLAYCRTDWEQFEAAACPRILRGYGVSSVTRVEASLSSLTPEAEPDEAEESPPAVVEEARPVDAASPVERPRPVAPEAEDEDVDDPWDELRNGTRFLDQRLADRLAPILTEHQAQWIVRREGAGGGEADRSAPAPTSGAPRHVARERSAPSPWSGETSRAGSLAPPAPRLVARAHAKPASSMVTIVAGVAVAAAAILTANMVRNEGQATAAPIQAGIHDELLEERGAWVIPPPSKRCPEGMVLIAGNHGDLVPGSLEDALSFTIADLCVDVTEVTIEDYRKCVDLGACTAPDGKARGRFCNWGYGDRGRHPVNCVDWHQASAYCESLGKRLPEEWEWERALRARQERGIFPWGNDDPNCARAVLDHGCDKPGTSPVGSKPAGDTPDGLKDMIGNVWEWTATGELRGGGWRQPSVPAPSFPELLHAEASERGDHIGFRCLQSPE